VRPVALSADDQVCDDDAALGRVALRYPVLGRLVARRVQDELLRARVPLAGSLDDQSRQHARLRLCQQEAAQLARRLDVAQARHLLRSAQPDYRACEQVELDGEADAKAA